MKKKIIGSARIACLCFANEGQKLLLRAAGQKCLSGSESCRSWRIRERLDFRRSFGFPRKGLVIEPTWRICYTTFHEKSLRFFIKYIIIPHVLPHVRANETDSANFVDWAEKKSEASIGKAARLFVTFPHHLLISVSTFPRPAVSVPGTLRMKDMQLIITKGI